MKYIAHRGLKPARVKENSLEAFSLAIKNPNYVGFECDVRTSLDQVFFIHHNALIDLKLVSSLTKKELLKKNLTPLKEVLKLKTDKIILIEIKESNIDIYKLHQLLNNCNRKIYVMSFLNSVIKKLSKLKRNYKIGCLNYLLNSEEDYRYLDFICLLEISYSHKLYSYFQEKGLEVFIYGIHKKETYEIIDDVYFITDLVLLNNGQL